MAGDQMQFEGMLAQAETRLRRLRSLYDQWFQGLERTEPTFYRTDLDKLLATMARAQPRNTALRFRYQQLVQRYRTYDTYWRRLTRQIEEGTYKRDVLRARGSRTTDEAMERPQGLAHELDVEVDVEAAVADAMHEANVAADAPGGSDPPSGITPFAMPKTTPGTTAAPVRRPVAAARPAGGGNNGLGDDEMRAIYKRYLDARRGNAERVDNVKYDTIARRVREMMPKLLAKHAGKKIDFETVVRDGKVALKPVVRKS